MAAVSPLHIPELIRHILGFSHILDSTDLLSVSLVCRTWSQITRTVRWRELELKTESWVDPYHQALVTQLQRHGALVRILVLKECVSTDPTSQTPSMLTVHVHDLGWDFALLKTLTLAKKRYADPTNSQCSDLRLCIHFFWRR